MSGQLRFFRTRGRIPQLDLLVEAGGGHALAVGRRGNRGNGLLVFERKEDFARRKVPNVGGVVSAAGCEMLVVEKHDAGDCSAMSFERVNELARGDDDLWH